MHSIFPITFIYNLFILSSSVADSKGPINNFGLVQ